METTPTPAFREVQCLVTGIPVPEHRSQGGTIYPPFKADMPNSFGVYGLAPFASAWMYEDTFNHATVIEDTMGVRALRATTARTKASADNPGFIIVFTEKQIETKSSALFARVASALHELFGFNYVGTFQNTNYTPTHPNHMFITEELCLHKEYLLSPTQQPMLTVRTKDSPRNQHRCVASFAISCCFSLNYDPINEEFNTSGVGAMHVTTLFTEAPGSPVLQWLRDKREEYVARGAPQRLVRVYKTLSGGELWARAPYIARSFWERAWLGWENEAQRLSRGYTYVYRDNGPPQFYDSYMAGAPHRPDIPTLEILNNA